MVKGKALREEIYDCIWRQGMTITPGDYLKCISKETFVVFRAV